MASDGVKTDKELAKEQAKADKLAKFQAKQAKKQEEAGAAAPAAAQKKEKKKKEAEVAEPEYVEETPKGQKKSECFIVCEIQGCIAHVLRADVVLKELPKAYNPKAVESAWYDWWEAQGYFKPEYAPDGKVKDKGSFVIVIPPPNVTGALHCGHAIATTLQDTLIRW